MGASECVERPTGEQGPRLSSLPSAIDGELRLTRAWVACTASCAVLTDSYLARGVTKVGVRRDISRPRFSARRPGRPPIVPASLSWPPDVGTRLNPSGTVVAPSHPLVPGGQPAPCAVRDRGQLIPRPGAFDRKIERGLCGQ